MRDIGMYEVWRNILMFFFFYEMVRLYFNVVYVVWLLIKFKFF